MKKCTLHPFVPALPTRPLSTKGASTEPTGSARIMRVAAECFEMKRPIRSAFRLNRPQQQRHRRCAAYLAKNFRTGCGLVGLRVSGIGELIDEERARRTRGDVLGDVLIIVGVAPANVRAG